MNYLLVTLGSWGDLHPFIALGRALLDEGHDVELMANAPYRAAVEAEGLRFSAACGEKAHQRTAAHAELWHPVRGFGVLWRHLAVPAIEPVLDRVGAWAREKGDASSLRILASPLAVGARLGAARGALPLCSVYTAPAHLRPMDDPMHVGPWRLPAWTPAWGRRAAWRALDRWKLDPLAREELARRCQALGLSPPTGSVFGEWVHSPQGGVALFPAWYGPAPSVPRGGVIHQGDFPRYRAGGDSLTENVLRFLAAGEPPVVIFPGSQPGPDGLRLLQRGVQACRALGLRSICLASAERAAGVVQVDAADGLVVPHAPLAALLPRARAFVHPGGIGSCAEGLAAAVPQLVMPFAYDQFDNAARVAGLQAGTVVESGGRAAVQLLEALQSLPPAGVGLGPGSPASMGSPQDASLRCLAALRAWEAGLAGT